MFGFASLYAKLDVVNVTQYVIAFLLFLLLIIGTGRKFFRDYLSKTITVKVKVADKNAVTYKPVKKIAIPGTVTDYIVGFNADGKTLHFKTSVWVYTSVKEGEKGTLRYKGDRFISFREERPHRKYYFCEKHVKK